MQQVLKKIFLIDEKFENNLKFWVLLGPFFLLLSIALASFELAIISALSLFLCYRFKFKGLYVSLALLISYSFYMQVNLETFHLWNLGLEISIALGLITTAFGLDEIKNFIIKGSSKDDKGIINLKKELIERQKIFENTEKNLQDNLSILNLDLDKKDQKITFLVQENEDTKKQLQESIQRRDYLLNELDQKVKEIEELKIKQDELYEKLSFLKDEEFLQEKNNNIQKELFDLKQHLSNQKEEKEKIIFQLHEKIEAIKTLENQLQSFQGNAQDEDLNKKINEKEDLIKDLENQLQTSKVNIQDIEDLKQKIKEKDAFIEKLKQAKTNENKKINFENISDQNLLKEYETKLKEFKKLDSLYQQLKSQFEDKQLMLHKTRQELFGVNEKLTAFQREKTDDFKDLNEYEKALLVDLDTTASELKTYKEENQNLQNLIGDLLEKSKSVENEDIAPSSSQ